MPILITILGLLYAVEVYYSITLDFNPIFATQIRSSFFRSKVPASQLLLIQRKTKTDRIKQIAGLLNLPVEHFQSRAGAVHEHKRINGGTITAFVIDSDNENPMQPLFSQVMSDQMDRR